MPDMTGEFAIVRAVVPARAVVHVAGVETEYLRVGRGTPVVLVANDTSSDDVLAMVDLLAKRHLVLAAAPNANGADALGCWLREFTEGLGVTDEAHLILHASVSTNLLSGDCERCVD